MLLSGCGVQLQPCRIGLSEGRGVGHNMYNACQGTELL